MHSLADKWIKGWKIIGRLFVGYVILQLMALLLLPLYVILDRKTMLPLLGGVAFVALGPLAVFVAASATRICRDLTEQPDAECAPPNGGPATQLGNADLESAHRHSRDHRAEVLSSELCGCFYCRRTFPPSHIQIWIDERDRVGVTALCPHCGIDAVIGSRAGFALTPEFLRKMYGHFF